MNNTAAATTGQLATIDLNDPNNTLFSNGAIGLDVKVGFRLSVSYQMPGDVLIAGCLLANGGGPYASNYSASRASVASVVPLTRGSQTVFLTARGDERLPIVTTADVRVSRAFRSDRAGSCRRWISSTSTIRRRSWP